MSQTDGKRTKINRNFWDWKPYFYDSILEQGRIMDRDGHLSSVTIDMNGRWAKAKTRDGCSVRILKAPASYGECANYAPWKNEINKRTLLWRRSRDDRYSCTCNAYNNGMLCSHLAALLFRWERQCGPFIFTETDDERISREETADRERKALERQRKLATRESVLQFLKENGRAVPKNSYYRPEAIFSRSSSNKYFSELALEYVKANGMPKTEFSTEYDYEGRQSISSTTAADNNTVRISFARDRLELLHCTCCRTSISELYSDNPSASLCEHAMIAALSVWNKIASENPGDETDRSALRLLKAVTELAPSAGGSQITDGRIRDIELSPRITLEKQSQFPQLVFTIGRTGEKQFVLRSFEKLTESAERREEYALSKNSSINFSDETFSDDSAKWYSFIESKVRETDRINSRLSRYYYSSDLVSAGNSIPLDGSALDLIFEMTQGGSLLYIPNGRGSERNIRVTDASVKAAIKLNAMYSEDGSFSGVQLTGSMPRMLKGNQYQYILDDTQLGRVAAENILALQPVSDIAGPDGSITAKIGLKKLPEFYYRVLPSLLDNSLIEVDESETQIPDGVMPQEPKFGFYLDIPDSRIICGSFALYGEESIPLPADREEGLSLRDFDQENRVLSVVTKYFPMYNDQNRTYFTDYSDDALARVMTEAVPELSKYGEVNGSQAFKSVRIHPAPQPKVSIQIDGGLLDLQIQTSDIDSDELLALLSSYRLKKKWHRLRSGDYVDLNNADYLAQFEDIASGLNIKLEDLLKGDIRVPLYRALYLDKLLEEHDQIAAARDKNFKSLVRSFSTVKDSDFEVPESLADIMRPYQVYGFRWLSTLAQSGFGGILADEMGLGKTLQVLALLLSLKQEGEDRPSLVVCPASLVYNWKEEVQRFTPELSVRLIEGPASQRKLTFADMNSPDHADLYVTSYDLLKRDIDKYQDTEFSSLILDEAQYIKNSGTASAKSAKTLKAAHRFALTGTPIENRLSELWSIFDFLMPGFLYTSSEFSQRFEVPIVKQADLAATSRLSRMTGPFILRRKKADVLKDLPDKLEEIQSQEMIEEQRKLYDAQVVRTKQLIEDGSGDEDKMRILAEITRLRQICCDPSLLFDDYNGSSAKRTACLELIQRAIDGGHRLLVFSQFTSMLDLIAKDLGENGIPFFTITGATPKQDRVRLVNEFNSGDVPVFLISLKAGGTGLNLTGADVVVHYDPWWNIAVQNQATDRAHRIGQTKVVNVIKLIAADSIEERIVKLQETKQDLADAVLGGQSGSLMSLSREELLELLS